MSKELGCSVAQPPKEKVDLMCSQKRKRRVTLGRNLQSCNDIVSPVILSMFAVSSLKNWLGSNNMLMMGAVGLCKHRSDNVSCIGCIKVDVMPVLMS